jgi:hypothetical protein
VYVQLHVKSGLIQLFYRDNISSERYIILLQESFLKMKNRKLCTCSDRVKERDTYFVCYFSVTYIYTEHAFRRFWFCVIVCYFVAPVLHNSRYCFCKRGVWNTHFCKIWCKILFHCSFHLIYVWKLCWIWQGGRWNSQMRRINCVRLCPFQ